MIVMMLEAKVAMVMMTGETMLVIMKMEKEEKQIVRSSLEPE